MLKQRSPNRARIMEQSIMAKHGKKAKAEALLVKEQEQEQRKAPAMLSPQDSEALIQQIALARAEELLWDALDISWSIAKGEPDFNAPRWSPLKPHSGQYSHIRKPDSIGALCGAGQKDGALRKNARLLEEPLPWAMIECSSCRGIALRALAREERAKARAMLAQIAQEQKGPGEGEGRDAKARYADGGSIPQEPAQEPLPDAPLQPAEPLPA